MKVFLVTIFTLLVSIASMAQETRALPAANPHTNFDIMTKTVESKSELKQVLDENKKNYNINFEDLGAVIGGDNGKMGLITAVVFTGLNTVAWTYAYHDQPDLLLVAVALSALVNYAFTYKNYYLKILDKANIFANQIARSLELNVKSRQFTRFAVNFSTALVISAALTIAFKSIGSYSDGVAILNNSPFWQGVGEAATYSMLSSQVWNINIIEWKNKYSRFFTPEMVRKVYLGFGFQSALLGPALINGDHSAKVFAMVSFSVALTTYFSSEKIRNVWLWLNSKPIVETEVNACSTLFSL